MYIQLFQEISILCIISIKFNKPLDIYSCIVMLNLFRAYGRELPPLLIQLTWSLTKSLPKSRSPAILPTVESPKLHNTHKYAEQMMHLIFTSELYMPTFLTFHNLRPNDDLFNTISGAHTTQTDFYKRDEPGRGEPETELEIVLWFFGCHESSKLFSFLLRSAI